MKVFIGSILIILFTLTCQTGDGKKQTESDKQKSLISLCKYDMKNAVKVINKNDMITALSLYLKFDRGGTKYYLLERESITAMIKSVTRGLYRDFILINTSGKIVYTMSNSRIFSRNVTEFPLKGSPLFRCFQTGKDEMYVSDVVRSQWLQDESCIILSCKVVKDGISMGVFLLQVDLLKLDEMAARAQEFSDILNSPRVARKREK